MDNIINVLPANLALQAALRPMKHTHFFQGGLLDSLAASQNVQICLSGVSEGISSSLLHLYAVGIHNYQLSMLVAGKEVK